MTKLNKKVALALLSFIVCVAMSVALFMLANPLSAHAATDTAVYSITDQTGLGLGINVVTAQQANDFTTGHSILEPAKISQLSSNKLTLNENITYNYSTSNVEELLVDFNLKFGMGAEAGIFVASLKNNLNLAGNFSYQSYSYKHFSLLEHKISRYRLYLDNYLSPSTYESYYSTEYLNDLNNLKTSNDYNSFFAKYGTHIVGSAIYGGRLYATYSLVSNKVILNSDMESEIQRAVSFDNLKSNTYMEVAGKLNANMHLNAVQSDLKYGFYVNAVGGNAFSSGTIDSFKSGYDSWTNSFSSDSNSVIVDYSNDGLVPLWDILPSQYSSIASNMQSAFQRYYRENANNVVKEFKTANYKEFNGGSGTASDPFLISTEQHLKNIDKVSMTAHYKVTNTITLTTANWTPIGGFYKEKEFEGTFDGNWHYIFDLTRTADIAEKSIDKPNDDNAKNGNYYFGLFGCIGKSGVVKNVDLRTCNIQISGPAVDNSKARVFIGALAGAVYGTVSNILVSGTVSCDICTNGISYVGSIAGVAKSANIYNCVNYARITSGHYAGVAGGIVGYSTGATIDTCRNYGTITAKGTAWFGHASAGGIVGEKYDAKKNSYLITDIKNCSNYGTLETTNYGGGPKCYYYKNDMCAKDESEIYG